MPDPVRKRFGYGQLWPLRPVMAITASVQPESGRIVYAGSDFPHPFPFYFSKEGMDHIAQNRPGSDLDGWWGFGQIHLVWNQAGVQESSDPVSGRTQSASYQFSTFWLSSVHPQTTRIILCAKPARIRFSSGWLCQVLTKRTWSGSKPMCKNHPARFWPMLPSRSGPEAIRIRHVYWAGSRGECLYGI